MNGFDFVTSEADSVTIHVPAKVILFGEHAVVKGHKAIVSSINQFMRFKCNILNSNKSKFNRQNNLNFDPIISLTIRQLKARKHDSINEDDNHKVFEEHNETIQKFIDFIFGKQLAKYSANRDMLNNDQDGINKLMLRIDVEMDEYFDIASGLGSSSALCVGLAMIKLLYENNIDSSVVKDLQKKNQVFLLALEAERSVNPNCSGVDTAGCLYGNTIVYAREKQVQYVEEIRDYKFWVIYTGKTHDTASVVKTMLESDQVKIIHDKIADLVDEVLENGVFETQYLKQKICENARLLEDLGVCCDDAKNIVNNIPNAKAKVSGGGKGGILVALDLTQEDQTWLLKNNYKFIQVATSDGIDIHEPGLPLFLQRLQYKIGSTFSFEQNNHQSKIGYCTAPSNIALLKYWGKDLNSLQMAVNPSVSLTLSSFRSFTQVHLRLFQEHVHILEKDDLNRDEEFGDDNRVLKFLKRMLPKNIAFYNNELFELVYISENNFPSSCGIASSASGFCAIVGGVFDCLGVSSLLTPGEQKYYLANWMRIGSGSSCRSMYNGLVEWNHQSVIQRLNAQQTECFDHFVVVFNPLPKKVKSSDGHKFVETSQFHFFRRNKVVENLSHLNDLISKYVAKNDPATFDEMKNIIEYDSMMMHAVMTTATPPAIYLTKECTQLLDEFMHFRERTKIRGIFTNDAGPNPHFLIHREDTAKLLSFLLRSQTAWVSLLQTQHLYKQLPGLIFGQKEVNDLLNKTDLIKKISHYKCILLSGKRYGGKSFLAERLTKELKSKNFAISDNIKTIYCQENNIDINEMLKNRELKEQHRHKMIDFMQMKLKEDIYFWDWMVFKQANGEGNLFIISDGRRKNDLEFFKKMTDCIHIRITCPNDVRNKRGWTESAIDHMDSETGLDDSKFDFDFVSDGGENTEQDIRNLTIAVKEHFHL